MSAKPSQPDPSHRRGSPHRRREPLYAKSKGFVRFLTSKHHLDTAIPLRSASTALQITLQLRRPLRQSTAWIQPLQCDLHTGILRYSRERIREHFRAEPRPSHRRESPHRRQELLYPRKQRVSCDSERPNITSMQQFQQRLNDCISQSPETPYKLFFWVDLAATALKVMFFDIRMA
jgi:hypothetical protein